MKDPYCGDFYWKVFSLSPVSINGDISDLTSFFFYLLSQYGNNRHQCVWIEKLKSIDDQQTQSYYYFIFLSMVGDARPKKKFFR